MPGSTSSDQDQNENYQIMSPHEVSNDIPVTEASNQFREPPSPPDLTSTPQVDFSPPKKSKAWLWILVALFLIILVPAGLIYATEAGYLNLGLDKYYNAIGLERLWKGLPVDAQKALLQIREKIEKANSYHFSANMSLQGSISTEDISQITKLLPQNLTQNQSGQGRVLGETTEPGSGLITIAINGTGDFEKPNRLSMTLSLDLSQLTSSLPGMPILPVSFPNSISIDVRQVNNKLYLKMPALSVIYGSEANKWVAIDLGQYDATQRVDFLKNTTELAQMIKPGQARRLEKISGKSVYHYQLVFDKSKFNNFFNREDVSVLSDPKFDFYVGRKDHLPYKIVYEFIFGDKDTRITVKGEINLSDFDKSFNIEAPKEEEIHKKGLMGLFQSFQGTGEGRGETGGNLIKARDARRKIDLSQIKTALDKYKLDNDTYPVSPDIDKTNNKDGVLSKALVPKYIEKLPVDPNDPTYWYGYKSDGKSYTLWSLLENTADPDGTYDGKYFKYIVRSP